MLLWDIFVYILALVIVLAASLIIYARWNYGSLELMGIPVVKPHWLFGSNYNYMEMYHHWEDLRRSQTHGSIYGVYNGREGEVHISDPQLLRLILLQDSEYFSNKLEQDWGHKLVNEVLELLNGEKWKTIRALLTPLFTTSKLRNIFKTVAKISDDYVKDLIRSAETNKGRINVDFNKFLPPFAIEVIGEAFCGIKLKNARDPENEFVKFMKGALFVDYKLDWTWNFFRTFPFLLKLLPGLPKDIMNQFTTTLSGILDEREKSGIKISDTVNTLLEMRDKCSSGEFKRLGINIDSVYGQAYEFFAASYFGILTTLNYLCYNLATNPEVNSRLMDEVDTILNKSNGEISYDSLSKMDYMTACISEAVRKTPGFFRLDRVCTKDWEFKEKGLRIKKGTSVVVPMYAVHYNEDIYPEANKFLPDRFMPENKEKILSCTFLPFGQGHRQCLGTRVAYEIFKIFLTKILKEFQIVKAEDTEWVDHPGNHFNVSYNPIKVQFVKRTL